MRQKVINVADNSGTRRRNAVLKIWRNDIAGMDPGSVVMVRFTDDYTRNGHCNVKLRKYVVLDIKFDDDYARQRGRHTVTLRKEKEAEMEKSSRRDAERQRVQIGNAAKLRKALLTIRANIYRDECGDLHIAPDIIVEDVIDKALAEPPRNCERFLTWEEAKAAYWREQGDPADWRKLGAWLFAAEEEGRGDGAPRAKQESGVKE